MKSKCREWYWNQYSNCSSKSTGENDETHWSLLKAIIGSAARFNSIFLFVKFMSAWVVGRLHYMLYDPQVSITPLSPSPPFFRLLEPLLHRVRQRWVFLISRERLRRLEGTRRPRGSSRDEGKNEIERGEAMFFIRSQLRANVTLDGICTSRRKNSSSIIISHIIISIRCNLYERLVNCQSISYDAFLKTYKKKTS